MYYGTALHCTYNIRLRVRTVPVVHTDRMRKSILLALTRMAASASTWHPRTPAALHGYLEGTWNLEKTMTYHRGGVTGTFSGVTTFTPLEHPTRHELLKYKEDGQALLGPEKTVFQATKRLLWDFAGEQVARQQDP